MVAVEVEQVVAEREGEFPAVIVQGEVAGEGVVVHLLAGDEVALAAEGEAILAELLVGFVLLVVAVAVGVVEGAVDAPLVSKQVRDIELVVALPVVVGLVGVVHGFAVHVVFAGGVVGGVVVELVVVGAVPGDAGGLAADDGEEFYKGLLAVPAGAAEEALLVGAPTADVAVGGEAAVGEVEGKSALHDTRTGADAVLARVPAAEAEVGLAVGAIAGVEGLQVDGGAEGGAAACGGSHAALYLQALGHAAEVGDVVPIDRLALCIVKGDAVDVDVDTGGIDTTDAQGCGAHGAVLARCHHRRLRLQHVGQADAAARIVQLVAADGGGGQRSLVAHTGIAYDYLVEGAHSVALRGLGGKAAAK